MNSKYWITKLKKLAVLNKYTNKPTLITSSNLKDEMPSRLILIQFLLLTLDFTNQYLGQWTGIHPQVTIFTLFVLPNFPKKSFSSSQFTILSETIIHISLSIDSIITFLVSNETVILYTFYLGYSWIIAIYLHKKPVFSVVCQHYVKMSQVSVFTLDFTINVKIELLV